MFGIFYFELDTNATLDIGTKCEAAHTGGLQFHFTMSYCLFLKEWDKSHSIHFLRNKSFQSNV